MNLYKKIFIVTVLLSAFLVPACQVNDIFSSSLSLSEPSRVSSSSIASQSVASAIIETDEELIALTLKLMSPDVAPVFWWIGTSSPYLEIDESVEPFGSTDEESFYPVGRFSTIKDMKEATEQIVTKRFAEAYLYDALEEPVKFIEKNGKLYCNTYIGVGAPPIDSTQANRVIAKSESEALIEMVFSDGVNFEKTYQIRIQKEDNVWKLDSFLDFE